MAAKNKNLSPKIKITPAKGRPMLHWVVKKPLDYVKGFPTQLVEVFNPLSQRSLRPRTHWGFLMGAGEAISYNELKDNWQNLLFHGDLYSQILRTSPITAYSAHFVCLNFSYTKTS